MENRHIKHRIQACSAVIAAIATVFTLSAGAAPATWRDGLRHQPFSKSVAQFPI
jgi:hypothetical protein